MDVNVILTQMINEEFAKIEKNGEKVVLKSRKKYYWVCAGAILGFLVLTAIIPFAFIGSIVFAVKMAKNSNIDTVIRLAKKSPNTPIEDIIREDMR